MKNLINNYKSIKEIYILVSRIFWMKLFFGENSSSKVFFVVGFMGFNFWGFFLLEVGIISFWKFWKLEIIFLIFVVLSCDLLL